MHDYIEESRQLQTLVRGWFEEALVGTSVDCLNPWLVKKIKLKQPTKLQEVMRRAKFLEDCISMEKCQYKGMGSKFTKTIQIKDHLKGKEVEGGASKSQAI